MRSALSGTSKTGVNKEQLTPGTAKKEPSSGAKTHPAPAKLSYKDQRELDALPARIEALEQEQQSIRAELADGTIYARDGQRAASLHARDAAIEDELMAALERWENLSSR